MAHPQTPAGPWTQPHQLLPDGPAVRLALGADATGAANWEEWQASGKYSRLLVACPSWRSDDQTLFVLKLQQDAYSALAADPSGVELDNSSIDRAWQRELEAHRVAGAAMLPTVATTTESRPLPATTYCRTTGAFFRTFCPDTQEPLRTCRNDRLLRDFGLEDYTQSLIRYAMGAFDGSKPPARVYTWSREGGRRAVDGLTVRRRGELYRDYAGLWQRDLANEQRARLERDFPCWTCPHRNECYASSSPDSHVLAEDRLVPLNYHEAHALLLEGADLPFDALGAVLGGAPADALLARHLPSPPQKERRELLAACLDGPRTWQTPGASAAACGPAIHAQLAREVATIKLRAFEQVCRSVALFHQRTGHAHLDLSPQHVLTRFHVRAFATVPGRWTAMPRLLEVDLRREVVPDAGSLATGTPTLFVPQATGDARYRSPLLDIANFRGAAQGTLRLTAVTDQLVECTFLSPSARFQNVKPGDVVRLLPARELPGIGDRPLVGRVAEVQAGQLRAMASVPASHRPAPNQLPCEVPAEIVTYQSYGPACDLWGLGMLLTNLLLVHDGRDAFAAEDLVRGLIERFERNATDGQTSREEFARSLIAQTKGLDSTNLLHDQRARNMLVKEPLPRHLWSDLWVLVLRLMSRTSRFAFATCHGDPAPMDEVCETIASLAQRIEVEAFGTEARRQELAMVLAAQLRQVSSPSPSDAT
jgi:hypothetical protein